MKVINSLKEISNNYKYYIIDLWGVLHDGITPYPYALETLSHLKSTGAKIALLSNAPRRAIKAKNVLKDLGFNENLYDLLLTSGEITFEYAQKNYPERSKYYYIGPEKDRGLFNGLNYTEVATASEADFAVVTGFTNEKSTFAERKPQADECLKAGLTLLCANPDRKVVRQTGEVQICAGLVAEYYEENNGKVIYFGKPYSEGYKKIIETFDIKNPKEVLCIGDSFHTDIKGANIINADALLVAIGIHSKDILNGKEINLKNVEKLAITEDAKPTHLIYQFS